MTQSTHFFAADLGATSGRTIVGTLADGKITLEELTRFPNRLIAAGRHYYWDIFALYDEIVRGLKVVAQRGINIQSIGIDTWGCDMVCVAPDADILRNPLAYRDPHTEGVMEQYFDQQVEKDRVYEKTGIQFMPFNSLFQLYAMRQAGNTALQQARKILFTPDALIYMLTGKAVCERTIASTSQILNARTSDLDPELLASLGLTRDHFGPLVQPGTVVGTLSPEVQTITHLGPVAVTAVAGHDTASAVAAVPAQDERFAYLSSGTWSLMGIESKEPIINDRSFGLNFTNEGGIEGTTRFLKNICGMWIYERCRQEWTDAPRDHATLQAEMATQPAFRSIIHPDDPSFANPPSMVEAIRAYCQKTGQPVPEGYAATARCIFESLALRYRQVMEWLQQFAAQPIDVLHIIGGGSLNAHLNQFTANSCGVRVLAGPQEATAIGNVMLQAKAAGMAADVWQMRGVIAQSVKLTEYLPRDKEVWDEAYAKYLRVTAITEG